MPFELCFSGPDPESKKNKIPCCWHPKDFKILNYNKVFGE